MKFSIKGNRNHSNATSTSRVRRLSFVLLTTSTVSLLTWSILAEFNATSARNTSEHVASSFKTSAFNPLVSQKKTKDRMKTAILQPNAAGATIHVNTTSQAIGRDGFCSLPEAIYSANLDASLAIDETQRDVFVGTECEAGNGDDTIVLPAGQVFKMSRIITDPYNYMGPTGTPIIFSNITIEANGSRLEHDVNSLPFRAFAVGSVDSPGGFPVSGTGALTIIGAHIKGFSTKGGNGAAGGGGGMGAGGAIYVHVDAGLTIDSCTFEVNGAQGGNGAHNTNFDSGGGGGGLYGNGGVPGKGSPNDGGGGGGGSRGNGGAGGVGTDNPGGGGRGGGGGGTVANGGPAGQFPTNGGYRCGGDGGDFPLTNFSGDNGDDGGCPGGGGGGGQSHDSIVGYVAGDGGDGAYGGGGGGGGHTFGSGGGGGFGGGGGAGTDVTPLLGIGPAGGTSVFGGGGGAGHHATISGGPGKGGFLGGDANERNGGGGAGLGGAIFNHGGTVRIFNSTFTLNFVEAGLGGEAGTDTAAENGSTAGAAIFSVNGSVEVYNSTIAGNLSGSDGAGKFGGIAVVNLPFGNPPLLPPTKSFILRNTIVSNNGSSECAVGPFISTSGSVNNLITHNDSASPCPAVVKTDDPQLGLLQINAPGLTPTMAIDPISPAFDAGDDANTQPFDQRGIPRPQGEHSDIGAYEVGCPSLTCPGNIVQSNDTDQCGAIVNYSVPNTDSACSIEFSHPSGSFFPIGTTTVTWTRGSESCSFTVTVNDTQTPTVTAPANKIVNNDPGQCSADVDPGSATGTDNCSGVTVNGVRSDGLPLDSPYPGGTTTINWTSTDAHGNTSASSAQQTITVNDTEPPSVTNLSASPVVLWPPNHTMRDVSVNYSAIDNCSSLNCVLSVASNEPVNGTGDGDTAPDWAIVDSTHVRLRAERAASGGGRTYTITVTCTDTAGNTTKKQTTVIVAHNISAPVSGAAFKINTPVSFSGTFWDAPGKTHTARWNVGDISTAGIVTEPKGLTNGTVKGTYSFSAPGIYKVTLNVTDNTGLSTSVSTAGDLEAIVVIYDPSGGYTIGGGWVPIAPGSYSPDPSLSGKLGFGFNSKYSNATNPKGNALFRFALGNFEFNSLNYDYLSISGGKAQFKGFGKINGDAGYYFILTVIDGDVRGGDGVDRFRIKIWSKATGAIVLDNQSGTSDAANPVTSVGLGSSINVKN